jgi:hypothetical protein
MSLTVPVKILTDRESKRCMEETRKPGSRSSEIHSSFTWDCIMVLTGRYDHLLCAPQPAVLVLAPPPVSGEVSVCDTESSTGNASEWIITTR